MTLWIVPTIKLLKLAMKKKSSKPIADESSTIWLILGPTHNRSKKNLWAATFLASVTGFLRSIKLMRVLSTVTSKSSFKKFGCILTRSVRKIDFKSSRNSQESFLNSLSTKEAAWVANLKKMSQTLMYTNQQLSIHKTCQKRISSQKIQHLFFQAKGLYSR